MSETEALTIESQTEPTPGVVVPRWLHICEIASFPFAMTFVALRAIEQVPHSTPEDTAAFKDVSERFSRIVQLQIGTRAWTDAVDEAIKTWNAVMDEARLVTAEEEGDKDDEADSATED